MSHSILLQSKEHGDILDIIDLLRSWGVSHYIDLPQVIVCGDQSSGKSSVLEALSSIPFPRKDNLCTRFATEVILRRSELESISVSIVLGPGSSRTESAARFERTNVALTNIEALLNEASIAMGIDSSSKFFSNDVLRFEVQGPNQPQLTLVDLPGLFQAGNKAQSDDDAEAVRTLVRSYMENPRSIILAVVSAKNDFANQIVTRFARELDPHGRRTLGIITKPDTLHVGSDSEKAFVELAQNNDVVFQHGWHVLKNRDFDTMSCSLDERNAAEDLFFSHGVWASIRKDHVAIAPLRSRLSVLLRDQVINELPSLVKDTAAQVEFCEGSLQRLGPSRKTKQDERFHLLSASQMFTSVITLAVDGSYHHNFFDDPMTDRGRAQRLRAVVQNMLIDFSRHMRCFGHTKHIVEGAKKKSRNHQHPDVVTSEEMIDEVLVMMTRTRGRELPGTYNPLLVGDLFFNQAKNWHEMARNCLDKILGAIRGAVGLTLGYVTDERTGEGLKAQVLKAALDRVIHRSHDMLANIIRPHQRGHPITYNHYFTDNLQSLRSNLQEKTITRKLDQFFGTSSEQGITLSGKRTVDVKSLAKALVTVNSPDMDRFACGESIASMRAYYKVALKTFVDDFSILVVENCILQELPNLFNADVVLALDDDVVETIAAEIPESKKQRKKLSERLTVAKRTLQILDEYASLKPSVSGTHQESAPSEIESEDEDAEKDMNTVEWSDEAKLFSIKPESRPIVEETPKENWGVFSQFQGEWAFAGSQNSAREASMPVASANADDRAIDEAEMQMSTVHIGKSGIKSSGAIAPGKKARKT